MKLAAETAKRYVGKYIDRYRRFFGAYPMQIVEGSNGDLFLIDRVGVRMPIPENDDDFNCQDYDYIFTMEESGK